MSADRSNATPLGKAVRQSAMTSRLLGVDFIPIYRSPRSPTAVLESRDAAHAAVVEPLHVEVKPVPLIPPVRAASAPRPAATPAPVPAPTATPDSSVAGLVPALIPLDYSSDPRRSGAISLLQKCRERYDADAPHQHFVTDHHSIVFGEGDPCARLMFVGEAPGADEDRTGRPFVGRAGQLLTRMINAMGLRREDVYITNVLKTRPPNNATPTIEEARLCAPYLYEQISIIRPEAIVTLGLPATRLLLNTDQSMSALRGRWSEFAWNDIRVPVMPTYHPAFLLRSYTKENREKVWSDLQKAMDKLGLKGGRAPAE